MLLCVKSKPRSHNNLHKTNELLFLTEIFKDFNDDIPTPAKSHPSFLTRLTNMSVS